MSRRSEIRVRLSGPTIAEFLREHAALDRENVLIRSQHLQDQNLILIHTDGLPSQARELTVLVRLPDVAIDAPMPEILDAIHAKLTAALGDAFHNVALMSIEVER